MGQRERLTGGNQDVKKRKATLDGQRFSTVNGNLGFGHKCGCGDSTWSSRLDRRLSELSIKVLSAPTGGEGHLFECRPARSPAG